MTVNKVTTFTPNLNNHHSPNSSSASLDSDNDTVSLSFQIMTRAEPLEVVVATIESLLAIKSADDEVLVIDNNHTNKALYEPLAAYCTSLASRLKVRFYHVDKVDNFKSGALNLALQWMDKRCSHIVVVDSDYQALSHARVAITDAIKYHPEHALLQFPQFYRDKGLVDVHSELNHYFNYHLYRPFNRQRALSTGTFAVIRKQALTQLGGWSGASITEDAQMGVLMHRQGLKSEFIPKVIATGLLPTTLPDLICQRQRWIYGNMQVLTSYFARDEQRLIADKLPFKAQQKSERLSYIRAHLSQLSAWVNFTGVFILLQLTCVLIITGALVLNIEANMQPLLAPLYAVYASYALFLARRFWAYSQDSSPLNQQVHHSKHASNNANSPLQKLKQLKRQTRAWLLHLNFWEFGALSWMPVLWGRDKPFICTPKQALSSSTRSTFIANIKALPKLLLVLNLITLLLVSPLSSLYSPVLFTAALAICLIKVLAASVVLENYRYQQLEAQVIDFKPRSRPKSAIKLNKTALSLSKVNSINPRTMSNPYKDNKAANS